VVACAEGRRRDVRRQTSHVQSDLVDRRRPANEYRVARDGVELVPMKCESDELEDASTPVEAAAAETDDDVETLDDRVVTSSRRTLRATNNHV